MKLLNDEPTLADQLGRVALIKKVAQAVASCEPPQVFGIHGDWGAGKTSVLLQLQWHLSGQSLRPDIDKAAEAKAVSAGLIKGAYKNKVEVVWFEAWRYQHDAVPIVALLHEIRNQLGAGRKAFNYLRDKTAVATESALLAFENVTRVVGIQPSKIRHIGEQRERNHHAVTLPSQAVRSLLEYAIQQLIKKKKLVVIVDDLDRCEAETAYRLLEGIKVYLNIPNCVFILGMDRQVIHRAIAQQMPDETPALKSEIAAEYMEKLYQHVWSLPLVRSPSKLLASWVRSLTNLDEINTSEVMSIVDNHSLMPPNPRKIKGFANVLRRIDSGLNSNKVIEINDSRDRRLKLLVLMACLYHFHPRLYRILESSQGHQFFDKKLVPWVRGETVSHDLLEKITLALAQDDSAEGRDRAASEPLGSLPSLVSVFPDPVQGAVLRVQSLILEIVDDKPVTKDEFDQYMLMDAYESA